MVHLKLGQNIVKTLNKSLSALALVRVARGESSVAGALLQPEHPAARAEQGQQGQGEGGGQQPGARARKEPSRSLKFHNHNQFGEGLLRALTWRHWTPPGPGAAPGPPAPTPATPTQASLPWAWQLTVTIGLDI